jgi:hypothetical protein
MSPTIVVPADELAVLLAHQGAWEGEYLHVDAFGAIVDQHTSHLKMVLTQPLGGADADGIVLRQTNTYTWADGRVERVHFEGRWSDGALRFDNERILGHLSRWDDQTMVLNWVYKSDPSTYLYELIQLSKSGRSKTRTWHWMRADELVKRTLIHERKISD